MRFWKLLPILAVPFLTALAADGPPKPIEEGYFNLFFRNTPVGYEKYAIFPESGGKLLMETESQFNLPKGAGNIRFFYRTREIMDATYNPLEFEEAYVFGNQENRLRAVFDRGKMTDEALLGGKRLSRTKVIKTQNRILEEAVYSLYTVLFKRYVQGKTAKQVLSVYIPKVAVELNATITLEREGGALSPDGPVRMRRFGVDVGGFQGVMLDVDDSNVVQRILVPRQEIELVRDPTGGPKPEATAEAPASNPAPTEATTKPAAPAPPAPETPPATPPSR